MARNSAQPQAKLSFLLKNKPQKRQSVITEEKEERGDEEGGRGDCNKSYGL
jgi:hypothetical protein